MGKTSKSSQSANQCPLLAITPNQAPPGGPDPGTPDPDAPLADPRFEGTPEGIPQHTFIMAPRTEADDYTIGAETYHRNCGLEPIRVNSLGHLVELLAGNNSSLSRIRLVTHASGEELIMPLFGETTVRNDRHAFEAHIRGFAHSDERGILTILFGDVTVRGSHGIQVRANYFDWRIGGIMTMIRDADDSLLTPFGLTTSGTPDDDLERFIFYCCDYAMVEAGAVTLNGGSLGGRKDDILLALDTMMDAAKPPATAGRTALRTFLINRSEAELLATMRMTSASWNHTSSSGTLNIFSLVRHACEAINDGFRAKLNSVRSRFNENSIIDIRGCRAGSEASYLRAVQLLFGRENNLPVVNGPQWFQYFGPCVSTVTDDNTEIRNLFRNGTQAAANRTAFEEWAERSQVNERHKDRLLLLLDADLRGNTIRICQLEWRNEMPPLFIPAPGWEAFVGMGFSAAIARFATLFNLPNTATPSGAALTTIATFVTTRLDGWAAFLFSTVDEANKAATFTALSQIDDELGSDLVPATAPNPLQTSDVERFQRDLIDHIEANELSAIHDFMLAVKARLEDAANPGIYYYMLNIGLPVFLFRDQERVVAGRRVNVQHNRIVVHRDFEDVGFRRWIRMLWDGELPAANSIETMKIGNSEDRRFALMVSEPHPGNHDVFACPHPGYMEQLRTVTNTPDPF